MMRGSPAVLAGKEDAAFAGGSYVIVQKYLHDLDE
jgi:putative iron-dependent peroxidase